MTLRAGYERLITRKARDDGTSVPLCSAPWKKDRSRGWLAWRLAEQEGVKKGIEWYRDLSVFVLVRAGGSTGGETSL